jgi:hypothetical protein
MNIYGSPMGFFPRELVYEQRAHTTQSDGNAAEHALCSLDSS